MIVRAMERADSQALARLHLAAFPGFFLSELGESFLELYYRHFTVDRSSLTAVALDENGSVLGFVVGATHPQGFYQRLLRRDWFRFGVRALPSVLRHPGRVRRLLRALRHPGANPPGEGVAGLFSLAVSPGAQGRSIGRILVDAFIDQASTRRATQVFLTTDAHENDRVNRFYERCGFRLVRSYVTPEGRAMNEYRRELS